MKQQYEAGEGSVHVRHLLDYSRVSSYKYPVLRPHLLRLLSQLIHQISNQAHKLRALLSYHIHSTPYESYQYLYHLTNRYHHQSLTDLLHPGLQQANAQSQPSQTTTTLSKPKCLPQPRRQPPPSFPIVPPPRTRRLSQTSYVVRFFPLSPSSPLLLNSCTHSTALIAVPFLPD